MYREHTQRGCEFWNPALQAVLQQLDNLDALDCIRFFKTENKMFCFTEMKKD